MAKKVKTLVKMVSTEGTGYFYLANKNPKTSTNKYSFRKYDPVVRRHVEFKETKMK